MKIEIHEADTANSGYYDIWFKVDKILHKVKLSEQETNSMLSIQQKEKFFIGQYKFVLTSPYDVGKLKSLIA